MKYRIRDYYGKAFAVYVKSSERPLQRVTIQPNQWFETNDPELIKSLQTAEVKVATSPALIKSLDYEGIEYVNKGCTSCGTKSVFFNPIEFWED